MATRGGQVVSFLTGGWGGVQLGVKSLRIISILRGVVVVDTNSGSKVPGLESQTTSFLCDSGHIT